MLRDTYEHFATILAVGKFCALMGCLRICMGEYVWKLQEPMCMDVNPVKSI